MPPPSLLAKARGTLERITTAPSELLELWDEGDEGDEGEAWREEVGRLAAKLR